MANAKQIFDKMDLDGNGVVSREELETYIESNSKFAPPASITEPAQLPGVTGKPKVDVNTAYHNMQNECSAKSACGCQKEKLTDKVMLGTLSSFMQGVGSLDQMERSASIRTQEKGYTEQYTKLRDTESKGCDPKSVQSVVGSRFHPTTVGLASRGDKIAVAHIAPVWDQLQKRCDNKLKYADLAAHR